MIRDRSRLADEVAALKDEVERLTRELQDARTNIEPAYYAMGAWEKTRWMGVPCQKYAADLFILAEILHEVRPALVVELGTSAGGSALFMAHVMDLLGYGMVFTVDQSDAWERPRHDRIIYWTGSTRDPVTIDHVTRTAHLANGPVLVDHDADHSAAAVRKDLATYAPLVTPGSYFIAEDTNTGRPGTAAADWVASNPDWEVDRSREKLILTMHPGGYLRRKPAPPSA